MPGRLTRWLAPIALAAMAEPAVAQPRHFDIPALEASEAIRRFASLSDMQILAPSADLAGVRTNAVKGLLEPRAALEWLLEGTELELVPSGETAFIVRRARPAAVAAPTPTHPRAAAPAASPRSPPDRTGDADGLMLALPAVDRVVVTGSRIDRGGAPPTLPLLVDTYEDVVIAGIANVGEAIEGIPGFSVSDSNPVGGQATFGVGQTFVNFLGLGSQRTLTLVNNRRHVSSVSAAGSGSAGPAGQQVDLNLIPVAMIDRIETIAIGGAPIYGSDAVAGAINILLKDSYEGVRLRAQYGVTQRGDAEDLSVSGLFGRSFASERGSSVFSIEYNRRNGLIETDRDFLRERRFFAPNPADTGPNDGIPALIVLSDQVLAGVTDGGLPLPPGGIPGGWVTPDHPQGFFIRDSAGNPVQFAPDGTLVPYRLGQGGGDTPVFVSGGDGVRIAENFSLLAPTERLLVNGRAAYAISNALTVFTEVAYAHSASEETRELLAISAATIPQDGPIRFSTDNPFLSPQAKAVIEANGLTEFDLARNLGDLFSHLPGNSTLDLVRVVAGLEGAQNDRLRWDVSVNFGRSENRSEIPYINDTNFNAAVNAVRDPATGRIVCADAAVAGCAPLNLFGLNAASAEAIAFVTEIGAAQSVNEQFVVTANLGGGITLPGARRLDYNLGAEHRREFAAFRPDDIMRAGSIRTPPFVGVSGSFHTYEVYGEARAPLLAADSKAPFVEALTLEAAARFIQHSRAGADVTWTGAATLTPRLPQWAEGLSLRGVYSRAIRAPAATELFLEPTAVRATAIDPCDRRFFRGGTAPALREENCRVALAAVGAGDPADFTSGVVSVGVVGVQAGNADLGNEVADSWSAGAIWRREGRAAVSFSADWINVSLRSGIGIASLGSLLAGCYDSADYPNRDECASFTRGTGAQAGQIVDYSLTYSNITTVDFTGLMAASAFRAELADIAGARRDLGRLHARARLFYIDRFTQQAGPRAPVVNIAGLITTPRVEAQAALHYHYGKLDLSLRGDWSSATRLDNGITIEVSPVSRAESYLTVGASVGFQPTPGLRAQIAANNLFDAEPPANALIGSSAAARRAYDMLGRRVALSLTASF